MLMLEATLGDFAKVVADACQTERATLAAQLAEAVGLLRQLSKRPNIAGLMSLEGEADAFLARVDGDGKVGG
jgi:hypothetical protein